MPLTGTRPPAALGEPARMRGIDTEQWEFRETEILQLLYEIDQGGIESLLPPALHPTVPPTMLINAWHVPDSDVGEFTLAEVRIGCRSGARPRAMLLRAYCNSERAADELEARWGYPISLGEVRLKRLHDRATLTVLDGDEPVLDCALIDPEAVNGNDLQYISSLNLASVPREGGEQVRLVQVDPEFVFQRADRGQPELYLLDTTAWGVDEADPVWAVSASYSVADITMPHIRYIIDPEKPPMQSVERVREK